VIALATSRVFARSPPGSVQPAAATAWSEEAAAVPALPPADGLAEPPAAVTLPAAADFEKQPGVPELLLPQPPTARPAATTRDAPATVSRWRAPITPPCLLAGGTALTLAFPPLPSAPMTASLSARLTFRCLCR
jgi:hypothetical protein